MRFHVVGLPSNITSSTDSCAFTALTGNFIKMMASLGHQVYHYGVGCKEKCTENIVIGKPETMDWTGTESYWPKYNQNIIDEVNKRKQHGDFVCVINGILNKPLLALTDVMVVEYAIGYNHTFAAYRVFASNAHMHRVYGAECGLDPDGYFYDAVIPHYLDPLEYTLETNKKDYYLYIGRLIKRKGVHIAVETCKKLGVKLILAGQGCIKVDRNKIYCEDGETYEGDNLEYVGTVSGQVRLKLYQNAIATFAPTIYLEPFGLTVLESQFTGTPVITTAWGAFPETVEQGKTGFCCRTLNDFVQAAQNVKKLSPRTIREFSTYKFGINQIRHQYQHYFESLSDLWSDGWYTIHERIK